MHVSKLHSELQYRKVRRCVPIKATRASCTTPVYNYFDSVALVSKSSCLLTDAKYRLRYLLAEFHLQVRGCIHRQHVTHTTAAVAACREYDTVRLLQSANTAA